MKPQTTDHSSYNSSLLFIQFTVWTSPIQRVPGTPFGFDLKYEPAKGNPPIKVNAYIDHFGFILANKRLYKSVRPSGGKIVHAPLFDIFREGRNTRQPTIDIYPSTTGGVLLHPKNVVKTNQLSLRTDVHAIIYERQVHGFRTKNSLPSISQLSQ